MNKLSSVCHSFETRLGSVPALVVRAPGRVNLIGEHTDYNDGFVLPMAIDRAVWIALRPRDDRQVMVHALDVQEVETFALGGFEKGDEGWAEYVKGVAWSLQESGYTLNGWEGVLTGNVPRGAGLSSSAALELATARAFAAVSGLRWHPTEMARLCRRAENEWVGVQCGMMDQVASAAGKANHAVLIDCRSLELKHVPLPPEVRVLVLDTAKRRELVHSAYNERRRQCEAVASFFGVPALRDLSLSRIEGQGRALNETLQRRARHVVTENARTLAAFEAMQQGATEKLGHLMDASHASLRDDFQVSTSELDVMVSCSRKQPGCYGARMTGAGFGGCAVALVRKDVVASFVANVTTCYRNGTGIEPVVYVCRAANGAEVIDG